MLYDNDTVDVLIVGAGASGGAFAWSLSQAGIQVMCLEQGDWIEPTHYPSASEDWELSRLTDMSPDPNVRGLPQDYPVNNDDSPIAPLMHNAVGGSTIHWSAHFPRFRPSDFRVRTLDGVADDFPMTYFDLGPFFELNDTMTGVAGLSGDPAYPPKSARQTRPVPLGKLGETIARGFDELGWHWWPSDSAILTEAYDGARRLQQLRPVRHWVLPGREGQHRRHLLAKGHRQRRRPQDVGEGQGNNGGPRRARRRRRLLRPVRQSLRAEGQGSRDRLQRCWNAQTAA